MWSDLLVTVADRLQPACAPLTAHAVPGEPQRQKKVRRTDFAGPEILGNLRAFDPVKNVSVLRELRSILQSHGIAGLFRGGARGTKNLGNRGLRGAPGETRTPDLRFRNELKQLYIYNNISDYKVNYNNQIEVSSG